MKHAREDYNRIKDPAGLIPQEEPVFVLRAQDRIASAVVRYWARLNEQQGGDPRLTDLAEHQASCMDEWPKKKLADL